MELTDKSKKKLHLYSMYICMYVHAHIVLKLHSLFFLHSILSSNILDNFLLIAKYSAVKYRDDLRFSMKLSVSIEDALLFQEAVKIAEITLIQRIVLFRSL